MSVYMQLFCHPIKKVLHYQLLCSDEWKSCFVVCFFAYIVTTLSYSFQIQLNHALRIGEVSICRQLLCHPTKKVLHYQLLCSDKWKSCLCLCCVFDGNTVATFLYSFHMQFDHALINEELSVYRQLLCHQTKKDISFWYFVAINESIVCVFYVNIVTTFLYDFQIQLDQQKTFDSDFFQLTGRFFTKGCKFFKSKYKVVIELQELWSKSKSNVFWLLQLNLDKLFYK